MTNKILFPCIGRTIQGKSTVHGKTRVHREM